MLTKGSGVHIYKGWGRAIGLDDCSGGLARMELVVGTRRCGLYQSQRLRKAVRVISQIGLCKKKKIKEKKVLKILYLKIR